MAAYSYPVKASLSKLSDLEKQPSEGEEGPLGEWYKVFSM